MMVEINITLKDVEKYIVLLVMLNAIYPQILKEYGIMINLRENENSENIIKMPYEYFVNEYDYLGLNEIAK